MYVDKTELMKIENLEDSIDTAWCMASEIKGQFTSNIIGHDVNGDIAAIETYLKAAAQKTQKLRLTYEKEFSSTLLAKYPALTKIDIAELRQHLLENMK